MYHNCSINCQEKQGIIQDNNSCYHFPVFLAENIPQKLIVSNCIINILLLVTATIGNTLVLSVVWKTPSLRSPSIVLLCGLASTDLVVGFVVQPLFLSMELLLLLSNSAEYHCDLGKAYIVLSYTVCSSSLMTVTAISLDRLLALWYHLRYASIVTVPRAIYVMTLNWLISGFMASLVLWSGNTVFPVVMAVGVAICLCLSTFAHLKLYLAVRRHQQQIHAQVEAVQVKNCFNVAHFKRKAVNAFVIHYFLLLCFTPLFINFLLSSNRDIIYSVLPKKAHRAISWKLTTTIVFLNSSVNPLIYCWRLREMRVAVKKALKEIFCGK
ncbi:melanocyte-stimulating hormone receptor-like [Oculina patagonica]